MGLAIIMASSLFAGRESRADLILSISSPDDLSNLAVGATATFDISVAGTDSAPGYLSASIAYDPTIFGDPLLTAGAIIPDASGFDSSATGGGTVSAYYDDSIFGTAAITSDGVFYEFTLTRLTGDATTLSFSGYSAQDDSGNNIPISTAPDFLSVDGVSAVPEPSSWVLAVTAMAGIAGGRLNLSKFRERIRRRPRPMSGFVLEGLESRALLSTITWLNPRGGDWDTPTNWKGGVLPGPGDAAVINIPGITVTHNSSASDAVESLTSSAAVTMSAGTLSLASKSTITNTLSLAGGTFTGAGAVTVNGLLWSAGTMSGSGSTTVVPGGTLTFRGNGSKLLDGRSLSNGGTGAWTGNGDLDLADGAALDNLHGATFEDRGNGGIVNAGGATSSLSNAGTFLKTTIAGTTVVSVPVMNSGSFSVAIGSITFAGDGTSTGSFAIAAGSTVAFSGDSFSLGGGSAFTGGGTTLITGGATITVTGTSTVANLTMNSGLLTGAGTLNVSGLTWTGGSMTGMGVTNVENTLTVGNENLAGYGEYLDQRTLNNFGTATLDSSGYGYGLYVSSGGTIDNEVRASFAFVSDTSINDDGGSPSGGTFVNAGFLSKTGGTGTSTIYIAFSSTAGVLDITTGTISLDGGGDLGGDSTIVGSLNLAGGSFTLDDGLDLSGTGTVNLTGGTTTVAGIATLSNFSQSSGTLTGGGTLTVTGELTWFGGEESGAGTTNAEGGLVIGNENLAGYGEYLDQRTLNNFGTATLDSSGYGYGLYVSSGGTIDNEVRASFAFVSDTSINDDGGSPSGGTFENTGVFSKTGGTSTSTIYIAFSSTAGVLDITTGIISLAGGGDLGGDSTIVGSLNLAGGTFTLDDGLDVSGTGTVNLTGGTTTVAGIATLSNFSQSGGTLTGGGTLTVTGQLTWFGGEESGAGTTNPDGGLVIGNENLAGYGEYLDQRTLNNFGTATLDSSGYGYGLYVSSGGTIDNEAGASFAFVSDTSINDGGGSPDGGTFVNAGVFSKTGGTGTSTIYIAFSSTAGVLDITTGMISLDGGGDLGGDSTIVGSLNLAGGSFTLDDGLDLSGTGTVNLTGGTTTVAGMATLSNFSQSGGTLTGGGTLTVTGQLTWVGGEESGAGTTNADGGLVIGNENLAGYGEYLDQRTLNNFGTATLDSSGYGYGLYVSSGGTIDNEAGASFAFVSDTSINDDGGSPSGGTFVNAGALLKTGGTGTSYIYVGYVDAGGTVNAETGNISL
jgi:hypothetical protein